MIVIGPAERHDHDSTCDYCPRCGHCVVAWDERCRCAACECGRLVIT